MKFRALGILLVALGLIIPGGCSGNTSSDLPTLPVLDAVHPAQAPSPGHFAPGHNILGYWKISVDTENGACEAVPARTPNLHLNVLSWMEFGPCTDCLKITKFEVLINKDLQIEITFKHPFTQPNLTGFDVRGIAMFEGTYNFPAMGLTASAILDGNPELINAEGHTTLYNPSTAGNGFKGYLKGKIAPGFASPNATLNGFIAYHSNNNRRYFQAGDSIARTFLIRSPVKVFTFGYAVDASWDKPTTPVTVPGSFPLTANSLEAYKIETVLSNPLALTPGSKATLLIDVYDWQGITTIDKVFIEAPYFWDGVIEAAGDTGGPGTKRFSAQISNDYGFVDQGSYPVLIKVTDSASIPGALVDNTAYRIIQVPVIMNHSPVCAAIVSNPEPDVAEIITFTDTSTDPEGAADIVESWWDWENDGTWDEEGFEVTHSFSTTGVVYVNHMVRDQAGSSDTLDAPLALDVGLFITLDEDLAHKQIGTAYHFRSLDNSYNSGALINVGDTDGPWDFTTIGLLSQSNYVRILDDNDPEVASFAGNFNSAATHFIKYENMFDPFFPILYQAEYHHASSSALYIYGFHDPYVIGSSPFGPPNTAQSLAIPYPLTSATNYSFDINQPGFVLNYSVRAMGAGDVKVPYGGGKTYKCLLVRYRFSVSAADPVNGGTLNFAFIDDSGLIVANVIAVNDPPVYNWNTTNNTINPSGMALFQALNQIN